MRTNAIPVVQNTWEQGVAYIPMPKGRGFTPHLVKHQSHQRLLRFRFFLLPSVRVLVPIFLSAIAKIRIILSGQASIPARSFSFVFYIRLLRFTPAFAFQNPSGKRPDPGLSKPAPTVGGEAEGCRQNRGFQAAPPSGPTVHHSGACLRRKLPEGRLPSHRKS